MKTYLILLSVLCFGALFQNIYAQDSFAILEKNKNISVKNLKHNLNKTKDTLLLNSDVIIDRVYSLNQKIKRELDIFNYTNTCKVSLKGLTKGKHVFVVEQNRKKIIFVIRILKDNFLQPAKETKVAISGSN